MVLPIVTVVGNLTEDPVLRFANNGKPWVRFTVIANHSTQNRETGAWENTGQLAVNCSAWEGLADNIAASATKGMRVVVQGRLEERRYDDKNGQPRTSIDMRVDEFGPSLRYATAKVEKVQNSGGGFQSGGGQGGQGGYQGGGRPAQQQQPAAGGYQHGGGYGGGNQGGGYQSGGYGGGAPASRGPVQQPVDDPWNSAGMGGGYPDEPPF